MGNNKSIFTNIIWKFAERSGVQVVRFVFSIILARLLDPSVYGVLAFMQAFTALASIFIQSGFNTSLVQNKDVTDEDYSSVWWVSLGFAVFFYGILFAFAPAIAEFYNTPELVLPFRVLCLILIPGAFNSVQLSKVARDMNFKEVFRANMIASVVEGFVGIAVALKGYGLWALVARDMLSTIIACVVMWFKVDWRPKFVVNFDRIKVLFGFGWKCLMSGVIDTVYMETSTFIIGKKYNASTLGQYSRGKQFPQLIATTVNGAVSAVMLPVLSSRQEKREEARQMMRSSITLTCFVLFPVLAGMAAVANPMVRLLLTDKWLPCVPYLQVYCVTFAFNPLQTCNIQAVNSVGRSDLCLKLEIIKKCYGILILLAAVFLFHSPMAIAVSTAIESVISIFVNGWPNKKLMNYSGLAQLKDLLPALLLSVAMFLIVEPMNALPLPLIVIIILQVIAGVAVYIAGSAIFRLESFIFIVDFIKKGLLKRGENSTEN